MSAAIDDKMSPEEIAAAQQMAARIGKIRRREAAAVPGLSPAPADTSILPTNPVARELVLACRYLRAQGR